MADNLSPTSPMRYTSNFANRTEAAPNPAIPSLSELMAAQLRRTHVPRRVGGRQSLANRKIRNGTLPACGAMEAALDDEFANGMTTDQALAFVGVFRRWVLMRAGVVTDVRDFRQACLAEQRAQSALDPKQLASMETEKLSDIELEAMQPLADFDAEASALFAYAIDAEMVRRWSARQTAAAALRR